MAGLRRMALWIHVLLLLLPWGGTAAAAPVVPENAPATACKQYYTCGVSG
ncbi:MAG: hypothetical protein HC876_20050 [Chloroflexaceae bacterium]|nr:hypothetical protein [Chloroflexaceae bacterium]